MLILIVAGGPDKGRMYELNDDQSVTLGREGEPIALNDRKASREHARLWCEGGTWYIDDCQSRHGTWRNQKKVQQKTPLKDGDRLQIGGTVFVLARMPVEHAERAALLGDPPDRAEAAASMPATQRPRRAYATVIAGVVAAALIIGLNVFMYRALVQRTDQLRADLADTRDATVESNETLLAEVQRMEQRTDDRALAAGPAENTPQKNAQSAQAVKAANAKLDKVLAAVRQRHAASAEQLSRIRQTLAQRSRANRPLLEGILAQARAQRKQARTLSELRRQIEQQQETTAPVLKRLASAAKAAEANRASLAKLRKQLDARPAASQQPAVPADMKQTLDTILTELRQRPSADEVIEPLRHAIADSRGDTRDKLERVLARLEAQNDLKQSIGRLRQTLAARTTRTNATLDRVESALRQQPAQLSQAVRLALNETDRRAAERDAVLAAIDELKQALPADATPLVKRVLKQQSNEPSAKQIAEAVEAAAAPSEALRKQLASLEKQVRATAKQTAPLTELTRRLAERQIQTRQRLTAVLDAVRNREAVKALRQQVRQLAAQRQDASSETSDATHQTLQKILAAVKQSDDQGEQPAAQPVTEKRLTRLEELVTSLPQQHQAQLSASMNRLRRTLAQQSSQTDQRLTRVLKTLKQQPTDQVFAKQIHRLLEAQNARAEQTQAAFDKVLATVKRDQGDGQSEKVSEHLAALRDSYEAQRQRTSRALERIAGAVAKRPTQAQLAGQLEQLQQQQARLERAQTERTMALGSRMLARLNERPTWTAELAQLRRMIAQQPVHTQQQIDAALAGLEQTSSGKGGAASQKQVLKAINELKQAMPSNLTPLVEQVLAAVRSQSAPAGNANARTKTADASDAQTDTQTDTQTEAQTKAVAEALHRLRAALGDDLGRLRRTVRSEVQRAIKETRFASGQASGSQQQQSPADAPLIADTSAERAADDSTDHLNDGTLTKTEMAYKLAFETGESVTIGAGIVNPATGKVSEGRTLDPASAKAAGIESWRDWYRMDNQAERRRLQRQAQRLKNQQRRDRRVINLPDEPINTNERQGNAHAAPQVNSGE